MPPRAQLSIATIFRLQPGSYTQMMAPGKAKKTATSVSGSGARGGHTGGQAAIGTQPQGRRLAVAVLCLALGTVLCAASVQSMLGSTGARTALASRGLMERIDRLLGSNGVAEPP